jgi:hypothetical protein
MNKFICNWRISNKNKNEWVEVYCEWLLKLANGLRTPITNIFLTTVFRFGLHPYLHITIAKMKCGTTLQQHKESSLFCEKLIRN